MNFSEIYRNMNAAITPSPALTAETVAKTRRGVRRLRPRRPAVIAAVLALALCVTPALAARTELGYQALCLISPAAAQFFQPVQKSCTDNGVTMEVAAVRVEGSTAQAYITLAGDAVDGTTDLYDSYNFHLPFDQIGHCERVAYDAAAHTATFLCTVETMDGSPIPTGGKMTFSLREFLSGKEEIEDLAVDLNLTDYASEAATAPTWSDPSEKTPGAYYRIGGGYSEENEALYQDSSMLLPETEAIAVPVKGISIIAAGCADGLFHIQAELEEKLDTDNHCWLWLEDSAGNQLECVYNAAFCSDGEPRRDYDEYVFDVSPADLANYTLHGYFCTSSAHTTGNWRVTFPLENT